MVLLGAASCSVASGCSERRILCDSVAARLLGPYHKSAVDEALGFIPEAGDMEGEIIIQIEQEQSTQYLIADLVESRESGRSLLEESPFKSSGSKGIVEMGGSKC